ncbi:ASKHA domain-containing protein [Desulfomonile tiedjei]|uniref:Putative metal-binding protein n=1 Tax=Desulfomonile tiedjei (strain ATCC 49306 / DSM 6799 / DCB-1) TaxID=706587 RepID=I4C5G1_DESTA|nr:ASKHA domain-containing protein [Desulfomonile tiedjei]AFM24802.1 putative metal-binding protein [Desulfomonile tiedjei DSM 6799]
MKSDLVHLKPGAEGTETVQDLLLAKGYQIRADCGGKGVCGKCKIQVLSNSSDRAEHVDPGTGASLQDCDNGYVLACKTKVLSDLLVRIPEETWETADSSCKTDVEFTIPLKPVVDSFSVDSVKIGGARAKDVVSIMGNLPWGNHSDFSRRALADFSTCVRRNVPFTLVRHFQRGIVKVLPSIQHRSLGLAIDLGTTTLAVYLCDLKTGKLVVAKAAANPQRKHGEDVITRIEFASKDELNVKLLQTTVVDRINDLIKHCLSHAGADHSDIDEIVAVGNTTMQHLLCGLNPRSLGLAPYLPVTKKPLDFEAAEIGLDFNERTNLHVFPSISGFVGGDAVAGALAENLEDRSGVNLLVDIGTNGELVLSNNGRLWATSCATGPALEGAHIECGMRAVPGAIDSITFIPETRELQYSTIGAEKGALPVGICGSGIIDGIAALRAAGIILPNGRLNEALPGVTSDNSGLGRFYTIVPPERTASGRSVHITLNDIRQIQTAKAALAVGIKLLMRVAGVEKIDRLVLTGAFGAHFDWRNAVSIGMLPEAAVQGNIDITENAAGLGAAMALMNGDLRKKAADLAEKTTVIELAEHAEFQDEFIDALDFPPFPQNT